MAIAANVALACRKSAPVAGDPVHEGPGQDGEGDFLGEGSSQLGCFAERQQQGGNAEQGLDVQEEVELLRMDIAGIETAMACWKGTLIRDREGPPKSIRASCLLERTAISEDHSECHFID